MVDSPTGSITMDLSGGDRKHQYSGSEDGTVTTDSISTAPNMSDPQLNGGVDAGLYEIEEIDNDDQTPNEEESEDDTEDDDAGTYKSSTTNQTHLSQTFVQFSPALAQDTLSDDGISISQTSTVTELSQFGLMAQRPGADDLVTAVNSINFLAERGPPQPQLPPQSVMTRAPAPPIHPSMKVRKKKVRVVIPSEEEDYRREMEEQQILEQRIYEQELRQHQALMAGAGAPPQRKPSNNSVMSDLTPMGGQRSGIPRSPPPQAVRNSKNGKEKKKDKSKSRKTKKGAPGVFKKMFSNHVQTDFDKEVFEATIEEDDGGSDDVSRTSSITSARSHTSYTSNRSGNRARMQANLLPPPPLSPGANSHISSNSNRGGSKNSVSDRSGKPGGRGVRGMLMGNHVQTAYNPEVNAQPAPVPAGPPMAITVEEAVVDMNHSAHHQRLQQMEYERYQQEQHQREMQQGLELERQREMQQREVHEMNAREMQMQQQRKLQQQQMHQRELQHQQHMGQQQQHGNRNSPPMQIDIGESLSESSENELIQQVETVQAWVKQALPELSPEDADVYSDQLVEDGFDTVALLESELTVEDLDFMKKAHKRAVIRCYKIAS